mmetsp:Transcript_45809/g.67615  ORF Transcript_45809/g.67615 Transcript_45809/m.67615 type:complete len:922 (-) Transcript_45809:416-3181(-)|eukprot:CAMPEP_0195509228 /NCGR_PEP_ID=MMETSP0794_2-20130614/2225_1 /TAXON_ID=515487 /ORGANISM="Stephanopyxis turris, Strain CCMP 815" /LENGTH=921 /DNA_ID=CAMNT_0040636393 /DNA_START=110 /DNA_END=2875 /DNA_ORIENTATION=-
MPSFHLPVCLPQFLFLTIFFVLSPHDTVGESNSTSNPDDTGNQIGTAKVITWAPILDMILFSVFQGLAFYVVFLLLRRWDWKRNNFEVYETRQYTRQHRSPPPFGGKSAEEFGMQGGIILQALKSFGSSVFGWAINAYNVSHDDVLRCTGLDSYMFLRFLRLGFRIACFASVLGVFLLIPVYYTGGATGPETEEFNSLTLTNVLPGSSRLWASIICWYTFVIFLLKELRQEWLHFSPLRYDFLAKGDVDTKKDYRYAVLINNVPPELQSNYKLRQYFNKLFPNKVRQAHVCLDTKRLDKLVGERQKFIENYEKADAKIKAKPGKSPPKVRVGANICCQGGTKVDAMTHYLQEVDRLNIAVDDERRALHKFASGTEKIGVAQEISEVFPVSTPNSLPLDSPKMSPSTPLLAKGENKCDEQECVKLLPGEQEVTEHNKTCSRVLSSDEEATSKIERPLLPHNANPPTFGTTPQIFNTLPTLDIDEISTAPTAFVTFTSLVAKQSAVQCEINGKVDCMDVIPAPEPEGIIWENVPLPKKRELVMKFQAALLWSTGILFWAVPVTFVTSLANLDSIMRSLGVETIPSGFLYGIISGLLPVWALALLMYFLPSAIDFVAVKFIKMKSYAQVDEYTFFWHQLYQFANLWFLIIGGSIFNQIDELLNEPRSVIKLIASAMTGSSVFFLQMVIFGTFANFCMELSMLPRYGMTLVNWAIQKDTLTQRMLDEAKKPPSISWGVQLPPMIFIFLVSVVYMPIVPIMDVFVVPYFGLAYLVWKHQCLHVYAQRCEGGGVIWEVLFSFLMGCLYMAELIFVSLMVLKKGLVQGILGLILIFCTIIGHQHMKRTIIMPLKNLALEMAVAIDDDEGELELDERYLADYATAVEMQLYGQPVLKQSLGERSPMPYRRPNEVDTSTPPEERVNHVNP